MISYIYFRAKQGENNDVKMVCSFSGTETSETFKWKDRGWAQLFENVTIVIQIKGFGKCSQT